MLSQGLLAASRGHFSDNDRVSFASQAAEGQSDIFVSRSAVRCNGGVTGC